MKSEALGQEELSWDPYAELPGMNEPEETPTGELSARPEEVVREQQQALGVAAIAGMLESGRDETAVVTETIEDTPAQEMSLADTVINRAEQALGVERFIELTDTMMDSAERDVPEVTMSKFRALAGSALMDAGELWQAVVAQSKREHYPEIEEYREQGKFYYTLSLDDLEAALATGKIERTDKSGNSLKSDLSLSGDRLKDGEWTSGYEEGKAVTLILDGSVVDKEDFVALRRRPTVDELNLKEYCLGFVSDFRTEEGKKVRRMVRKSGLSGIPVYRKYDEDNLLWATTMCSAEALRRNVKEYGARIEGYEQVRAEIYEDVDRDSLSDRIEKNARKMSLEKMMDIVLKYGKPRTEADKERAELALMRYAADALGIEDLPELKRADDRQKTYNAAYRHGKNGERGVVKVNTARLKEEDLGELVRTLGHEMEHCYQHMLEDALHNNPEDLSDEEKRLAKLYSFNFDNYAKRRDDVNLYLNQLVEVDAQLFGMACQKIYDQAVAEVNKPLNRMKRGVSAVRKGVTDLTYRGKRVARRKVA